MEFKRMFSYGRRNTSGQFEHNWETVELENFHLSRPLVLVLGGSGTLNDEQANGNVKVVESLLGVFKDDVDVLGVIYNHAFYDEEKALSINKLVLRIFLPLVCKGGKRLDVKVAEKNMRNITIFANCYGDFRITTLIVDKLASEMQELGYSQDEQKRILSQIFLVSYATSPNRNEERKIKSFSVISASDEEWLDSEMDWVRMLESKDVKMSEEDRQEIESLPKYSDGETKFSEFYEKKGRCFIFRQNDNELRVATGMLHKRDDGDHSFGEMKRQENWTADERTSKVGDYASRCLACALCHSVANSIINSESDRLLPINMEDLQAELENVVEPLNFQKQEIILHK